MENHKHLTSLLYDELIMYGFYRNLDNGRIMHDNDYVVTMMYNFKKDKDMYYLYLNGYCKSSNISKHIIKKPKDFTLRAYNGENSLNYYSRVIIDRHRNWYYHKMNKIPIENIQVKMDYLVINILYRQLNDPFYRDPNMNLIYSQIYKELNDDHKKQYEMKCQIVNEFNHQLKYVLVILHALLIREKKCKFHSKLWIQFIFPYVKMI